MILSYWFWLGPKVNISDILILKKGKGKGSLKGFGNLSEQAESLCAVPSTHKPGIPGGIACNFSTWEVKEGESEIQGHPCLRSKLEIAWAT